MDYIGEHGFSALVYGRGGQTATLSGITNSFATLDVNGDHKIDKQDANSTSDSTIKSEINAVLNAIKMYDNYSDDCGFATKLNFSNPNFYKEFPEFAEIAHSQGFTVPGEVQGDEAMLDNLGIAGNLFKFLETQARQPIGVMDEYLNNKYGNPDGVTSTPHFAGFDAEYVFEYGDITRTPIGGTTTSETTNNESVKNSYKQQQLEKRENELKKIEEEYTDLENEIKEQQEEYNVLMEQINSESEDEDVSTKQEKANGIEYELKTKNRNLEYLANDIYDLKNIIELSKSLM